MKENKLDTGKLTLLEILSKEDIIQITSIAKIEARNAVQKTKPEIDKEITSIQKKQDTISGKLDKHVQNKEEHQKESDITKVVNKEIGDSKSDIDKKIDDKIKKSLTSKELTDKVRELFVNSMSEYHKTLWTKRGFWSGSVK